MPRKSAKPLALLLCVLAAAGTARAHPFSNLIDERRYAEAEQAVHARLASDPRNADALAAAVELVLAQGQEQRLADAERMADTCVRAHPGRSECFEAKANVLAARSARASVWQAVVSGYAIRDAYRKAVELDPANFGARIALMRFYLAAPFVLGGGSGRARDLATDTGRVNPDVSILMQAMCDAEDGKLFRAEGLALSVNLTGAESVLGRQRDLLFSIAQAYSRDKHYADGARVANELRMRFPTSELGYYSLGLTAQAQGRHAEAVTLFNSALAVAPRASIYYRIGVSLQASRDKSGASDAFRKALASRPGLASQQRDDAQERLIELSATRG